MGKSSSSSKRIKHSKDSSKLRSVKKKKTKRSKPKKIRRLKDSSDENDSSGSDSSLYSTSEDDYRGKKLRKKRSRKRYSSSESDDSEDDYRVSRKKKSSKRKAELVGKKKKVGSRKRPKRYSSSSSTSSDSYSTRSSQSDDDDGSESDRKKRSRRLGKVRRSEDESEADSEPQAEDEVTREKKSRRLKSIVVVSYSYDNDDERKEDMVHDYDDERYREAVTVNGFEEDTKSETCRKDDELEAILKKRALENLKRFRGEMHKTKEVSSSASEGVLRTESEKAQESLDHGLMETSHKNLQVVNGKESGTVLLDIASQQDRGDTGKAKVGLGISSCTTKRKLIRPVLGQESLDLVSGKEVDACLDAEAESVNGSVTLAENIETAKASSALNSQSPSCADTETLDAIKVGSESEQKTMDEPKDESQYEQKTMSVMRGGELVQVSYKVYIPKKTSSLGRRQLKR